MDRRVRSVAAAALVAGWTAAAVVYATATDEVEDPDVYEMTHSRKYVREVERLGGRAGLLTSDLDEWLASLWHGRRLAYTLAAGTVVATAVYLAFARAGREYPPGA